jgi:hypothetical protein
LYFYKCRHGAIITPFRNPIVNPADILLPVNGIPRLVIANEDAVAAAAWPSPLLPLLIPRICISTFESVVITPSETL